MFLYLLLGQLPWQGLKANNLKERYRKIGDTKRDTPLDELCEGMPDQILYYMKEVRRMDFYDSPDYDYLRNMFLDVLDEQSMECDWVFDWSDKNVGTNSPASANSKTDVHTKEVPTTSNMLYALPGQTKVTKPPTTHTITARTNASTYVNTSYASIDKARYQPDTGMLLESASQRESIIKVSLDIYLMGEYILKTDSILYIYMYVCINYL